MPYKSIKKQREYQRKWCAQRKSQYKDSCCNNCKIETEKLNLHHIEPDRKIDHRIWSWSIKRLELELEKCEWLCGPCHHNKHPRSGCGTYYEYRLGCRCEACTKANTIRCREYRERKRMAR